VSPSNKVHGNMRCVLGLVTLLLTLAAFGASTALASGVWSAPTKITGGGEGPVSCSSATFCVTFADVGETIDNALTYNGTSWSSPTNVGGSHFRVVSVSCSSATFCAAIGDNGPGVSYALTYNGTSWSAPTQSDGDLNLNSVSCSSATFCVAVGEFDADVGGYYVATEYALTYNGTSWTAPTNIDTNPGTCGWSCKLYGLDSVSCPSATFCVAVGGISLTYTTAEASASVKIEKFKVTASSLVVTIKTSRAGAVTITGPGLKKTTRTVAAGTRVITVALTQAGKAERAGRRKIKLSVSLKTRIKTVSRSAEIKL
jgi:hypothetical protein